MYVYVLVLAGVKFYLGTHKPHWLSTPHVPLFISHQVLRNRKSFPVSDGPWVLDSGAFSEIARQGYYSQSPAIYASYVKRYQEKIGSMAWCSPQDWMCEPPMLARTGLTVADHIMLTVHNYLDLMEEGIPVIPVLQGWTLADYLECYRLYLANGIDLPSLPLVGVGSVCKRQANEATKELMTTLHNLGLKIHAYGFKVTALPWAAPLIASSDSMAWSYAARYDDKLWGCVHQGKCANCRRYALKWREKVLSAIDGGEWKKDRVSITNPRAGSGGSWRVTIPKMKSDSTIVRISR